MRALNPTELLAWTTFLETATRALDQLDRDLQANHDLTLADYEILVFLSQAEEHRLPMTDLARSALVSKSRLTYRVARLVAKGLVERHRCQSDGRRIWALLTDDGLALLEAAWPTHLDGVRRHVVDPIDPEDLPALQRSLEAMRSTLEQPAMECPSAAMPKDPEPADQADQPADQAGQAVGATP